MQPTGRAPADGGGTGPEDPEVPPRRGYGRSDLPTPRNGGAVRLDLVAGFALRMLAVAVLVVAIVMAVQWVAAGDVPSLPSLP